MMGNARVTGAIYEAFGRGDVAAVLARLDPAVEWRLAEGHPYSPAGEAWVGHAAVVENFFVRAGADWDAFGVAVRDLHDAGEVIVAEVRYSGRFPATGRELDAQGCHVWRLRDGKVVAFQQYVDTSRLQMAMGNGLTSRPRRKERR
jgi:uncharacterized protein